MAAEPAVLPETRLDAGTQPVLARRLGVPSATALVVSNMIGMTIFGTTGLLASALGDAWLILAVWVAGALLALAGALSYAELGLNFPYSGGEYVYLRHAYGPGWGFLTGWISFFAGFSAPIAIAAVIFAGYVESALPGLSSWTLFSVGPLTFGGTQALASLVIAMFTLLNSVGVQHAARVQNIFAGVNVIFILGLIGFGFALGSGSWNNFTQPAPRDSSLSIPVEFMIQLLWVTVGYSGWNAAAYVGDELKDPKRTLPRALILGTGSVALLYLALNVLFIYSTPIADLRGVVAVAQLSAVNLFGAASGAAVAALVAFSVMSTVNAMLMTGPRVYYAMALDGAFPSVAAKVHPRWRTPIGAILVQGLCSILMTGAPLEGLFLFTGFSLTVSSVLTVASLLNFRRQAGWQRLPSLNFCFPLIPLCYVAVGVVMIAWGIAFQPLIPLTVLAIAAIGLVIYYIAARVQPAPSPDVTWNE